MGKWIQDVQPNTNIYGRAGWCLEYVDNMFDAPHNKAKTAQLSWELAVGRGVAHPGDRNLPNVAVPVYFSFFGDGHVVTYVPGQGFYSVNSQLNGRQVFASIDAVSAWLKRGGGSYLGWSEEVDTKRVVHYVDDQPQGDGRIARSGQATVTTNVLNVRNDPSTNGAIQATYVRGQIINYDSYIDANGYRWLSYVSYGGTRRYIAQSGNGESYVAGGV